MFNPQGILKNPHIQTLYPTLFKPQLQLDFEKEIFQLADEDFLEPYWYKKDLSKPLVVLLHGLGGNYKSPYIPQLMYNLAQNGFSPVLMHFRGAVMPNRTKRSYHSGDTQDLREFLVSLNHKNISLVGFSLGANVLLKYLAKYQSNSLIKQAIAVSTPFLLEVSSKALNKGFAKLYQHHLLKDLKQMLLNKTQHFDIGLTPQQIHNIKNFLEFDELYTAPIHGFKNAHEYYKQSSSYYILDKIQTPTTLIHAKDDPFMNKQVIPTKEQLSNTTTLELFDYGGHVGFVDGNLRNPRYFLDEEIIRILRERF